MSYLNVPRLHFTGRFQADPSTVNNNDDNWNPATQLSDNPEDPGWVYWNPNGTHNWIITDCTVRGAATAAAGPFDSPLIDSVIGAHVRSTSTYPAKLVDLDPDDQCVSQIWGLQLEVAILDPTDATKTVASVAASLPPTAFGDLWNRAMNAKKTGMPTMCAAFQGVLQDVTWVNAAASPLLAALKAVSPDALSIRFNVDSYQSDANQSNFTFGRVVGTIGPAAANEAPRSTPRRLAPVSFTAGPPAPSIFSTYGPAGAAWDAARNVLILDLGNCVPTNATPPAGQPSVPDAGWPIDARTLHVTIPGPSVSPRPRPPVKSGLGALLGLGAPSVIGSIDFTLATYLTYAGVVEVPVSTPLVSFLASQPLTLTDATNPSTPIVAAREDLLGRYVDVDVPFFRFDPGDTGQVTLWATRFGQPWVGASLDVGLVPVVGAPPPGGANGPGPSQNGGPWPNVWPTNALSLSSSTITTGTSGTGVLTLTASDPGTPRTYPAPAAAPGPDGQVYWITGSWANWGMIFLFPGMGVTDPPGGAPINVLVFSKYTAPSNPTWDSDVGPILQTYARMFPYMMGIIDLGDYDTVKQNAQAIQHVLNLPRTDPHHMPVVRDLSQDKLAMINTWFKQGMVQS